MSALMRSNLRSSSRQVAASTARAGAAATKQASAMPIAGTSERARRIRTISAGGRCLSRQPLRQERECLSPGIGLGGPDGGLVLGGTLEAVRGAGVTVERMRDAQARELGIELVGILRGRIAVL